MPDYRFSPYSAMDNAFARQILRRFVDIFFYGQKRTRKAVEQVTTDAVMWDRSG